MLEVNEMHKTHY